MGCYDVVCALTNTPIKTGEKCYLYIFPKNVDFEYGVTWVASGETMWGRELTVFQGEYNDYGTVKGIKHKLNKAEKALLENFQDENCLHFFVVEEAWQWAQERFGNFTPSYIKQNIEMRNIAKLAPKSRLKELAGEEKDDQKKIETARLLMAFIQCCKHPLSGLGCYHQFGGEEIEHLKALGEFVSQRVAKQEAQYAEWQKDEDE